MSNLANVSTPFVLPDLYGVTHIRGNREGGTLYQNFICAQFSFEKKILSIILGSHENTKYESPR